VLPDGKGPFQIHLGKSQIYFVPMNSENSLSPSQSEIFLATEGDAWFQRNADSFHSNPVFHSVDFILKTLDPFKEEIRCLVEIGCGPGYKLEKLFEGFRANNGFGIDPSALAISSARERVGASQVDLDFQVGISSSLPFPPRVANLVFLGFFLYLVPREEISLTVSEIDRILKPGGFLAIEDFDAPVSIQNPYKHDERIVTYKDDYSKYLINDFGYHLIEKHSYSHQFNFFAADPQERVATTILFKPLK